MGLAGRDALRLLFSSSRPSRRHRGHEHHSARRGRVWRKTQPQIATSCSGFGPFEASEKVRILVDLHPLERLDRSLAGGVLVRRCGLPLWRIRQSCLAISKVRCAEGAQPPGEVSRVGRPRALHSGSEPSHGAELLRRRACFGEVARVEVEGAVSPWPLGSSAVGRFTVCPPATPAGSATFPSSRTQGAVLRRD